MGAGFFTNPSDVVKIRLQLQGELAARGTYQKMYKNTVHAAYTIAKHEGILALQAGLVPALAFQVVLNGIRLGGFHMARNYELTLNSKGETDILKTALVSGTAGSVGAVLGSPLYMVKIKTLQTLFLRISLNLFTRKNILSFFYTRIELHLVGLRKCQFFCRPKRINRKIVHGHSCAMFYAQKYVTIIIKYVEYL